MTYVWKPPPALPWCVTCLMSQVDDNEHYTCPLCPPEKPCPTPVDAPLTGEPISAAWPSWLPSQQTLAWMHGGAA